MSMVSEFKDFVMRGNVVDMAVGVVMGTAFGKIISSMVENVITPIISLVQGGTDFSKNAITLGEGEAAAKIGYGALIQATIDFAIIAFVIFMMIKLLNRATATFSDAEEEKPKEPSEEVQLLQEIRDALQKS